MRSTEVAKRCQAYIEELYKDPLTSIFKEINPDATYQEICPIPMDLRTVKLKLDENKYQSFNDWVSDMFLIFDNTIKVYHNKNQLLSNSAEFHKERLKKFINMMTNMNSRNLEQHLIDAYSELQKLLLDPPSHSYVCENLRKIDSISALHPFTAERITKLTTGINNALKQNSDKSKVILEKLKKGGLVSQKSPNIDLALAGRDLLSNLEHSV
ncbi:hypothetical protein TVAG_141540 [Trichomonas vaginalis G3]|uniref:Bromo domain-containing protein n=1 Tax=Trichomonas vaginalis (strain ATCC PRA-98 / G3) TaxID=412133 RepID=A2FSU8_TRIV3|nr:bromodomain family [Trichomonas vaginalis G3]EAX92037.1 hypothetical protein TVAG_141540 [Trichomonas vaginalis G3]KAI5548116.1 bromodomain family [Trichomonas vaginalis G3]|eukprot:XP_001304967.1 hypothetical protein [Trichomonas vaginalis G3]